MKSKNGAGPTSKSDTGRYSGVLSTPIAEKPSDYSGGTGLLPGKEQFERAKQLQWDRRFAKLPALFEAYGLAYGDWMALSLALAVEHVPGFRVVNEAGRPSIDELMLAEFALAVDLVRGRTSMKVDAALREVSQQDAWNKRLAAARLAKNPNALRSHYYRIKREKPFLMRLVELAKLGEEARKRLG
ncbi:MAG: hypothetical protein GXD23_06605 [Comamonadaceae bacterium]|nr:hypothetical protein [Comamonadaceae bacterium]